jgi:hypothetical protein
LNINNQAHTVSRPDNPPLRKGRLNKNSDHKTGGDYEAAHVDDLPTLTNPRHSASAWELDAVLRVFRLDAGPPYFFLSHINLGEMLGDLTVTAFLILLATSIVVVGSMVMFPLIDLAFEKKIEPSIRQHDDLTTHGETWQTGRPWLLLRSNFLRRLMSDLPPNARRGHLALVHSSNPEPHHWTSLIKRTKTAARENTKLVMPDQGPRRNAG